MGKRSRKRGVGARRAPADDPVLTQVDPRPRGRPVSPKAALDEAPPAPWGAVPLTEFGTLAGLVACGVGFFAKSFVVLIVGIVLVALFAVELSTREHFAGYKSHTSLLAGLAGIVVAVVLAAVGVPRPVALAALLGVGAGTFFLLRRQFQARTGGLSFRA